MPLTLQKLIVELGLDKSGYTKALKEAKTEAQTASAELKKGFGTAFESIGLAAAGVAAGVIVVKKAFEFGKEGAQLEFVTGKFDKLSVAVGTTGDALLTKLKAATKGTRSDMELMASASDFMSLGLVKNEKQVVRLTRAAGALNMNMNQLVLTLANKTTMRFDQLGVAVDGFDERVKNLKRTGMDTNAAFTEAFLQQAEAQIEKVGDVADTNAGKILKMEAAWGNFSDTMKLRAAPIVAEVAVGLTNFLTPSIVETIDETQILTREIDGQTLKFERHGQILVDVTEKYKESGSAAEKFAKEDLVEVAGSSDTASESLNKINIELGDITKNKIASESIKAINQSFKDGLIDNDTYEKLMYNVGRDMLNLPVGQIEASVAIAQLNKDFEDGKVEPSEYLEIISGIYDKLRNMPTNLDIVINYRTSGNPGDVDLPVGERKPKAPKKPKPPHRKKQFGGDFIVPEGYPDDTYPYYFSTGEHVVVQRSTTNNFNMHINSSARREDIQTDFNLMRALAG